MIYVYLAISPYAPYIPNYILRGNNFILFFLHTSPTYVPAINPNVNKATSVIFIYL